MLDDIDPLPDRTYDGKLFDDELVFLKADLDANKTKPTLVCCHIPIYSNLPYGLLLRHAVGGGVEPAGKKSRLHQRGPAHRRFSGAQHPRRPFGASPSLRETFPRGRPGDQQRARSCGSYWTGPMMGCPEGFGVADLGADGSFVFDYRDYGWKA